MAEGLNRVMLLGNLGRVIHIPAAHHIGKFLPDQFVVVGNVAAALHHVQGELHCRLRRFAKHAYICSLKGLDVSR